MKYQIRERKVMRRNPMPAPPITRYKGSFITRLGGSSVRLLICKSSKKTAVIPSVILIGAAVIGHK